MSVNKTIHIGNVTKTPDLRFTSSGTAVCNFSIACNERFKDKDGNKQEKVEYINMVAWRQLAEICGKYLSSGSKVYIEGKMQTRKYDDRDGVTKYITEVVADQMRMLSPKSDKQDSRAPEPAQQGYGNMGRPEPHHSETRGNQGTFNEPPPFDDSDGIPF